ncbi:MAG: DUF86 domain-containing protein [Defluviitaleaceae bacterium]|nr:DUF86 domain-containing protein [Defluviitaleaceae bacterium]
MNERIETILEYMLEDAEDAIAYVDEAGSLDAFIEDVKTRKAVIMSLLNIGEMANRLPDKFTSAHPKLPWAKMVAMRNIAAHGYHQMSDQVVWETVKDSLPELVQFLRGQLSVD